MPTALSADDRVALAAVGIYLGFQGAIGCGFTFLRHEDTYWHLSWESPRTGNQRYAADFGFPDVLLLERFADSVWTPERWGQMLASEVRQKWGGNPDVPQPDAKPLMFEDGLSVE